MKNTLGNAKKYLVETNFEFFNRYAQNVIGKTMFSYANHINEALINENNKMLKELKNIVKCWDDDVFQDLDIDAIRDLLTK